MALLTHEQAQLALDAIDPARCGAAARCDVAVGLYAAFREAGHILWRDWVLFRAKRYAAADAELWQLARSVHASMIMPFLQLSLAAMEQRPPLVEAEAAVGSASSCASVPLAAAPALGAAPPGDAPLLSYHDAGTALSAIPSDCSAEARRCVALGLQFGLGDAGRSLWLEWAASRTHPDPDADAHEWSVAVGHSAIFVVRWLQHAHAASLQTASAAAAMLANAAIDRARGSARKA